MAITTIDNPTEYFNCLTYTGNNSGGSTQAITGLGFSPDFVWTKNFDTNGQGHALQDTVRGVRILSVGEEANAEVTNAGFMQSFDSDGFTVGSDNISNKNGDNIVSWSWRGSDSTAVTNTDGSIDSTVSASTTSGFSVVTYAGDSASSATIGHGLGIAPKCIILTGRNLAEGWPMQMDGVYGFRMNSTAANDTSNGNVFFANTAPTTSVFTVGGSNEVNDNYNYVAYCFAEVKGFSKIGTYGGNGSANGTFVYTGFKPAFIMFRSTILCHWVIVDNKRNTFNVVDDSLYADTAGDQVDSIVDIDFVSNGFKWRNVVTNESNVSGQTYVYMAFAESPFISSKGTPTTAR